MAENEERTEQATPRRRQKAKEKGEVARSQELSAMSGVAGIMVMFYFAGAAFMKNLTVLTGNLLSLNYGKEPFTVMRYAVSEMLLGMLPFFGISVVLILAAALSQGGMVLKPFELSFKKINPVNGLKTIFSKEGLVNFLKTLFKFTVGAVIFYYIIRKTIVLVPYLAAMDLPAIQAEAGAMLAKAVLTIFLVFFGLAVLDYLFQRWKFERSLKMSKEEIREELKESEGDPLIKSRVKSIQRELARKRMMQEVPKATVVITNPTHIAVALMYKRHEMNAPRIIAKGSGYIAEKIRETAVKHSIPIVEDKPLARALNKLSLDSYIPEELYRAVAKLLAFIYQLRGVA